MPMTDLAPAESGPQRSELLAPLRVGIVAPPGLPGPPVGYGGTESMIDGLARGLQAAGHEVRLWTTEESTCPVPHHSTAPSDREGMGRAVRELRHVIEGYDWLVAEGCQVIHDHTVAGPFVAAAGRAEPEVPVVMTNHGPFSDRDLAAIFRAAQAHAAIVAISSDQAATGRRHGITVTRVIHHGIDHRLYEPGDGRGDDEGPYLLFLGRMNPDKGVEQAIDAARAAGERLLIAAKMNEPAEHEFYEQVIRPRCDGHRIVYLGEVGGADKVRLLGGATALLNPIRWPEPFGLVMVEALAAGTPVITRRCGAAPEIVEDGVTGFVCDDDTELVHAIGRVRELDRRACRASVEQRFSIERMVRDHVELYRSVITARSAVGSSGADPASVGLLDHDRR
jgi:glycosyltransferase involved in cell wall biosynthesis